MQQFHTALRVTLLYAAVTTAPVRAQEAPPQTPVVVANPEEMRPVVIPARPLLRLGTVDVGEAEQFERVVAVLRSANGAIVVADQGASQVRVFDARGSMLRTIGRRGEGPGEFLSLDGLFTLADTVFAWDGRLRRLSVFAPTGSLARTVTVQRSSSPGMLTPVGVLSNGYLLARATRPVVAGRTQPGVHRDSMQVILLDATGAVVTPIATIPGGESFVLTQGRSTSVTDLPFAQRGHATARDGIFVLAVSDRYEFDVHDRNGRLHRAVRANVAERRISDADLSRARDRELQRLRDIGFYDRMKDNVEQKYRSMPRGRTAPAFGGILLSQDGRVWIRLAQAASGDARTWAVHGADGQVQRTYELPTDVTLMDAGRDWILGTFRDELDVTYVGLWRLPT
jgi:hypothetical protein